MTETHSEMVKRLVKWMDTPGEDIHHACTGICGEVIELRNAITSEDEVEELGDLAFYMKHLRFAFDRWGFTLPGLTSPILVTRSIAQELLLKSAGDILDYGKKCWVYKKDPGELMEKFSHALANLEACYEYQLRTLGLYPNEVEAANQHKLSTGPKARYPLGYSDAAAQERADKLAGD